MITIEETIKIMETTSNITLLFIFTLVGSWAIYKWVKMNEEVKKAIVKEKLSWATKI